MALGLASCKAGDDMGAAEAQVAAFHEDYDAERFAALFEESSPVLKRMTPRPEFVGFISETRRRLGPVKATERTGWHVNYDTGGSQVTLTYLTTFANGEGTETFVYDTADPPRLLGYHISAPEVVVR
jgi:hypothetical protein